MRPEARSISIRVNIEYLDFVHWSNESGVMNEGCEKIKAAVAKAKWERRGLATIPLDHDVIAELDEMAAVYDSHETTATFPNAFGRSIRSTARRIRQRLQDLALSGAFSGM